MDKKKKERKTTLIKLPDFVVRIIRVPFNVIKLLLLLLVTVVINRRLIRTKIELILFKQNDILIL